MRTHVILLLLASVVPVAAQSPDAPDAAEPRVAVSGEVTATIGSHDPGFFNYASYDYSPLRNVRVVLNSSLRVTRHLEVLAQLRTDGLSHAQLPALYLRVRPWAARDVDLQVGRVPPTFGLFGAAGYGADNPLVSRPLAYGYLTSLRRDALPGTVADLLQMRGRGWLSQFPVGNTAPDRGLPLIDAEHWDTGVQGRVRAGIVEWIAAITAGSLASPRVSDDNDGRSLQTRVVLRPHPAVTIGGSAARGAYLSRHLGDTLPAGRAVESFQQRAAGLDLALAAGRWELRGEAIRAWWALPAAGDPRLAPALTATALWGEGRWRVWPGLDLTTRAERLAFGDVEGAAGPTPWEAAVTRVEGGVVLAVHRHVRLKTAWQRNWRPQGGRVRHDSLVAGQIAVWF
ncbi:MAG: hypothetical protein AB7H93_13720 [Vicinamibacterales bacterium]